MANIPEGREQVLKNCIKDVIDDYDFIISRLEELKE